MTLHETLNAEVSFNCFVHERNINTKHHCDDAFKTCLFRFSHLCSVCVRYNNRPVACDVFLSDHYDVNGEGSWRKVEQLRPPQDVISHILPLIWFGFVSRHGWSRVQTVPSNLFAHFKIPSPACPLNKQLKTSYYPSSTALDVITLFPYWRQVSGELLTSCRGTAVY